MKCDELKAYGMADPAIDDEYEMYKVAEVDEAIAELNAENESLKAKLDKKDAEIASLKAQIAEAKELSILLQKRNKDIADNAIGNVEAYKTKCDAEIESLKASHYAEMVDAGMRERRLRRALWLARAKDAKHLVTAFENYDYLDFYKLNIKQESARTWMTCKLRTPAEWVNIWKEVERKCLKKAEEYK